MVETETKRQSALRKIRAMIDLAEHPNTGSEEAATFRAKADEMMLNYSIEEFELNFARPAGNRPQPILRDYQYFEDASNVDRGIIDTIHNLFAELCRYHGIMIGWRGWYSSKIVGYERDIDLLDLMFTRLRLHMVNTIDPKPTPSMTWVENLAMLKETGKKWEAIHRLFVTAQLPDYPYNTEPWERRIGVRYTGVYTKYCKEHGRGRMYDSPDVYKRDFINGYVHEVRSRLQAARLVNEGLREDKAVVLASMEEDLKQAFWEMFPDLKPHPKDCDCDYCHYCHNPRCTRTRCVNARKPVRQRTARLTEVRFSAAAYNNGKKAGAEADLSTGSISNRREEI